MKHILIIGGSSGIGKAIIEKIQDSNHIYSTYNSHEVASTNSVKYFFLDVLNTQIDFSSLPEKIDALVYCPGSIQLKPFARISINDFRKDYELNVIGAIQCIQQLLPRLKKSEQASIILFSTVAVQIGLSFHSLVSSSKGAIEGLTKALAAELAPNIRVNCIAPSLTETPLAQALLNTPEKIEASNLRHPLKRIGRAQDIANLAAYLLSDESSWMTGQILHLDGGMSTIK
jgi:NAD(P)-dependent dehydrogenase (short-subunit alcohol dehydrogenase family)